MLRVLVVAAVIAPMFAAVALYSVSYSTRELEHHVVALERRAEALTREVATLRAERAFLSRPERIEPFARELGMRPAEGHQFLMLPAAASGSTPSSGETVQSTGPNRVR